MTVLGPVSLFDSEKLDDVIRRHPIFNFRLRGHISTQQKTRILTKNCGRHHTPTEASKARRDCRRSQNPRQRPVHRISTRTASYQLHTDYLAPPTTQSTSHDHTLCITAWPYVTAVTLPNCFLARQPLQPRQPTQSPRRPILDHINPPSSQRWTSSSRQLCGTA